MSGVEAAKKAVDKAQREASRAAHKAQTAADAAAAALADKRAVLDACRAQEAEFAAVLAQSTQVLTPPPAAALRIAVMTVLAGGTPPQRLHATMCCHQGIRAQRFLLPLCQDEAAAHAAEVRAQEQAFEGACADAGCAAQVPSADLHDACHCCVTPCNETSLPCEGRTCTAARTRFPDSRSRTCSAAVSALELVALGAEGARGGGGPAAGGQAGARGAGRGAALRSARCASWRCSTAA